VLTNLELSSASRVFCRLVSAWNNINGWIGQKWSDRRLKGFGRAKSTVLMILIPRYRMWHIRMLDEVWIWRSKGDCAAKKFRSQIRTRLFGLDTIVACNALNVLHYIAIVRSLDLYHYWLNARSQNVSWRRARLPTGFGTHHSKIRPAHCCTRMTRTTVK